jgi:hypothetical protein
MDERQITELCSSVRFISAGEKSAPGECRLSPVELNQETEEGYYARVWNPAAAGTLEQLLPSQRQKGWPQWASALRSQMGRMRRALQLEAHQTRVVGRFPADTILIRRSQKIILINRHAGWTIHLLRADMEHSRHLLQNELDASHILPEWTIPVWMSHLEASPYFIVQPYTPYIHPADWRQLLPEMARIMEALFHFYSASGLNSLPAAKYLDELNSRLRTALGRYKEDSDASRLRFVLDGLHGVCLKMMQGFSPNDVFFARVHGDFIAYHVVSPKSGTGSHRLLVDWSESHVYSIFHDLFYFHFQNHQSDFWDRFPRLTEAELRDYYGESISLLTTLLARETGIRLDMEDIRFNFMLGFLQELEHRLCRLHPRFLPFWIRQAERTLRSFHGQ